MEIIRTPIEDLLIFRPRPVRDEHGYFSRKPFTFRFSLMLGSTRRASNSRTNRGSYQGVRCGVHGRSGAGEAKGPRCPQVSPAGAFTCADLTGLWQVGDRSDLQQEEDAIRLNLRYVEN